MADEPHVEIRDPAEWDRILAARRPSPLSVSSDRQWFRLGNGLLFVFVGRR